MDVGDSSGRRRREARRASTLTSAVLLRQEKSAICPSKEIKTTSFRSLPQSSLRSSCATATSRSARNRRRFEKLTCVVVVVVVVAGGVCQKNTGNRRPAPCRVKWPEMLSQLRRLYNWNVQLRDFYTDSARLYIGNKMHVSGRNANKLRSLCLLARLWRYYRRSKGKCGKTYV